MIRIALPMALLTLLSLLSPALAQSDAEIAKRYAPVIYQESSIYEDQALDYLRRVDYDGDWNTKNNLNNAEKKGVDDRGYVYYEVKETETHYFVTYFLYYARRAMIFNIKRENHSAGVVIVARKGAPAGKEIELMFVTESEELKLIQTENARSWDRERIENPKTGRKRKVSVRKTMAFDDADIDPLRNHPRIHVECWNHNVTTRRRPSSRFGSDRPYPFLSGRGVVYHPHPSVSRTRAYRGGVVGYALLPMSELEKIENLDESKTHMLGSKDNKAPLPGAWEVPAPGFPKGALSKDPARVVDTLFKGKGEFSRNYVDRGAPKSGMAKALSGGAKR